VFTHQSLSQHVVLTRRQSSATQQLSAVSLELLTVYYTQDSSLQSLRLREATASRLTLANVYIRTVHSIPWKCTTETNISNIELEMRI